MDEMTELEIALTFVCAILSLLVLYLFYSRERLNNTSYSTIDRLREENKSLRQNIEKEIASALLQQKKDLEEKHRTELEKQKAELEKKFRSTSKSGFSAYTYQSKIEALEKEKADLLHQIEIIGIFDPNAREGQELLQKIAHLTAKVATLEAEREDWQAKFKNQESEHKSALTKQKNKYEREVAILKNQANNAYAKGKSTSERNCTACESIFNRQTTEALQKQKETIENQFSSQISALENRIKEGEQRETDLQKENLHLRQQVTPSPLPFEWDSETQELYRTGIKKGRLQTALSENIDLRFVGDIVTESFPFPNAHVEIEPDAKREKKNYQTFLSHCTCKDFEMNLRKKAACKHMFSLALSLDLISITGDPKPSANNKN